MDTTLYIKKGLTYSAYLELLQVLFKEGKTTGHDQNPDLVEYAKLNLQRMARVEKTTVISQDLKQKLGTIKGHYVWLVITEGWCGDAAQSLPVFEAIEKLNTNIELKIVLRDENPDLINQYLTNGSRSIPKLICFEKESLKELFVWGPRPKLLQDEVTELVKANMPKDERGIFIQKWYNNDKTTTLQNEIRELIEKFMI